MYDVIGDIHGQYEKLLALLKTLGYRKVGGAFRHPEGRQAVFVGDFIDRGPLQEEVLDAVRRMVEAGSGRAVMGNHEWNAIGYATLADDGSSHCRPRIDKNTRQHREFLEQVGLDSEAHRQWVRWFAQLPPFLDLGGIRVCHAWWNLSSIDCLSSNMRDGRLSEAFLRDSFAKGTAANLAVEAVTKGLELKLPAGTSIVDHEGQQHHEIRLRWWDCTATTYARAALVPAEQNDQLPLDRLPDEVELGLESEVPVFVGHYWLTGSPRVQDARMAVLDYSAAREGPLVAYRWEGEPELCDDSLVVAGADR